MCFAEIMAWQPPDAGSRPVPIGSRFIGVSLQPAIPRRVAPQQSPLPLHQSPRILAQSQSGEAIKCAAAHAVAPRWVVAPALAVSAANRSVISTLRARCHFYLAPTAAGQRKWGEAFRKVLRPLSVRRAVTPVGLPTGDDL